MRRCMMVMLGLGLALAASTTAGYGQWKMRVHEGATTTEFTVSGVDSVTFYDATPAGMVWIPAGTFIMGSPTDEPGRVDRETQHQVTLTRTIYVSKHEVTQAEWQSTMVWNDSSFPGWNRPVERVSWFDCISYCNRRSAAEGLDSVYVMIGRSYEGVHIVNAGAVTCDWAKNGYRLLTEAEWEYCCRAGSMMAFCNGGITNIYCGPLDANLDLVGWYCGNEGNATHDVGGKAENAWGLEDVHGNVWEWCWDLCDGSDYPPGPVMDPTGLSSGPFRAIRGGSYDTDARGCRSAFRGHDNPYDPNNDAIGLRVARAAQ